jgi:ribosomal protein S27E
MDSNVYYNRMIKFMKTLPENAVVIDKKVKDDTLTAVLNEFARFLGVKCAECGTELVDPVGIRILNDKRPARCAGCGFSTTVSIYNYGTF